MFCLCFVQLLDWLDAPGLLDLFGYVLCNLVFYGY